MTKAVRIHAYGGPEALVYEDVDVPAPGPGEVRLNQTVAGVNFLDIYHRAGTHFANLTPPAIPGVEAVGIVESVGEGVTHLKAGDKAAYPLTAGGYAETRLVPGSDVVKVPDGIDDKVLAATFMKGLTVGHMLNDLTTFKPGDFILWHAAAGGVGMIGCEWAKHLGLNVIGTVSTEEKAERARAAGCDHPIVYTKENFADRVNEITGGDLCQAVFDGVGADTWLDSLKCVKPYGVCAAFGLASGPLPPMGFAEIPSEAFV
ncbi:MAG: quinone oxidoreductase, partial [Alphaproteobacteria bacterium]|nr:quinone oxidoreductase [Alphaproteobacteria bacterium]